jgi:TusE/DsrC/DsvC family sulfur relay protein
MVICWNRWLVRGHEFHYSSLENVSPEVSFAYEVKRGMALMGSKMAGLPQRAGIVYTSAQHAGSNWAPAFVEFVRSVRSLPTTCNLPSSMCWSSRRTHRDGLRGLSASDLSQWSEDFARARARLEKLELTDAHWEVIRFLRDYYEEHRVQAQVRSMIKHFARALGGERGNNHHLHTMFPIGGPQKQGNRLAGLMKTKGEH